MGKNGVPGNYPWGGKCPHGKGTATAERASSAAFRPWPRHFGQPVRQLPRGPRQSRAELGGQQSLVLYVIAPIS